ncbi:MAG: hypothetical protein R3C52_01680 [Hyphomonadaceae bacterium]
MKARLLASAMAVAIMGGGALVAVQAGFAAPTGSAPAVAMTADNFQLTDNTRMHHELRYYRFAPAVVVVSQVNGSKFSRAAAEELEKLQASYKGTDVQFFLMNSTLGVTREDVSAEMAKIGVDVPVLMDEYQLVGESLGVAREGEVFVINPTTMKVVYHGPLDNRFEKSSPNTKARVKQAYAADAIDALVNGTEVKTARVDIKAGQTIAFPERANKAKHEQISYVKEIAPIIEDKCVACHQQGGVAPFQLDSYETVKGFAPMIRETIRTDRMPPYYADPHVGHFKDDQSLSGDQTKTLVHWIEAGAPRGEGADPLKASKHVAPEWPESLGKPDYVVNLPEFTVPASGIIEYQNQIVPNPFKEDKWLRAVAFKPGDRAVVHHMVSNHIPDPKVQSSGIPGGSVGSYTPGAEAQMMGDNAGAPIPAGGKLYFQMHYTASGKETVDHSQVGFYFRDKTPEYIKRSVVIGDAALQIPAHDRNYTTTAYLEFPADAQIYTLYPHAHLRGKSVELTAIAPDGTTSTLLSLPKYDFNWQRDYDPIEPLFIKAGTKLVAKWTYDNSEYNPANPDPTIDVTWGEQTHEEMMYFRVNYRFLDETSSNVRNDLQAKLNATRTLGGLDDNLDGLVQVDELSGPMARFKPRFASLDLDNNGGLDASELMKGHISRRARAEDEGL